MYGGRSMTGTGAPEACFVMHIPDVGGIGSAGGPVIGNYAGEDA